MAAELLTIPSSMEELADAEAGSSVADETIGFIVVLERNLAAQALVLYRGVLTPDKR